MAGLGAMEATAVRGHDPSERWADVGGAYSPTANVIAAGRGNASYSRYTGTILHELGHAYDAKTNASSDPGFREILRRIGSQTDPYYAQPGDAGAQEYFADLCRSSTGPAGRPRSTPTSAMRPPRG